MFHPHYVTLKNGKAALIRYVEPGDAAPLITHVNEVGAERVFIHTERLERSAEEEADILRKLDRQSTLYLVALIDGKLVGSTDVQRGRLVKNAHTATLGVAVRKPARGIGLGKALLEDDIRWAREAGVRKLSLTVFATNQGAIALYLQLGFSEEARLKGQVILEGVPVDEVVMTRWM